MDISKFYQDLLILQYRGKTKARAHIDAVVTPFIADQIWTAIRDAFSLTGAIGAQLDVVAKYAGVSRFGFDFAGATTLSDADLRQLINIAIVQNASRSSLYDIQTLLNTYFPGTIRVFDFGGMRIGYFVSSSLSTELAQFFVRQGRLPRPMGVLMSPVIYVASITNWFGYRTYDAPGYQVHGYNTYGTYDTNCHWLSYSDALIF